MVSTELKGVILLGTAALVMFFLYLYDKPKCFAMQKVINVKHSISEDTFENISRENSGVLQTSYLLNIAEVAEQVQRHTYAYKNDTGIAGGARLSKADKNALGFYYFHANSILEWGVGGSTEIAAYVNPPRYTGIDGSIEWLQLVQKKTPPHFRFFWADIGPVGAWSFPKDPTNTIKFPFYSSGPLAQEGEAFDVYFVDGRFRAACALAAFLHASERQKDPREFVVIIHDYKQRPGKYGKILSVAKRIDGCCAKDEAERSASKFNDATLIVLQRNPDVPDTRVKELYDIFKYNPV